MPVEIVVRTDLSLLDLHRLSAAGEWVAKTPHVGNMYPNNLVMAALGIPILCVDTNYGELDANFHPHRLICGGSSEVIADPWHVAARARILRTPDRFQDRFEQGGGLMAAHIRAFRDAFPGACIETYTDRAPQDLARVFALLEALSEVALSEWKRYAFGDGPFEERVLPPDFASLAREGIHGFPGSEGGGWITPNPFSILREAMIPMAERKLTEIWELSGPDMVRYMPRLNGLLTQMYDHARKRLGWELPEVLRMNIVPVADMRFAVIEERRAYLDEVMAAFQELLSALRGLQEGLSVEERWGVFEQAFPFSSPAQRKLRSALEGCSDIFYRIEEANCLSQYDLLNGAKLYVHPWGAEAKMQDVIEAMRVFRRWRPPKPKARKV